MDQNAHSLIGPFAYVVLFDGDCNLCNSSVNFIIDRDPAGKFVFAALDSKIANEILKKYPVENLPDSIILVTPKFFYVKSGAALRIARELSGLWPLLQIFFIIPRFLRDFVYDAVAARRYKWFGRAEYCRVMTPSLKNRFPETL